MLIETPASRLAKEEGATDVYGLVNRAIEELVTERFGPEAWLRVLSRSGVEVPAFVGMQAYPDELTYRLVAAASRELGLSEEAVLEEFGRYWTLYTAQKGYGELFRLGGATLREFLVNLPQLHTRVALMFPELRPPEFWLANVGQTSLTLNYRSTREGLGPMVVGLLKGLGEHFHTPMTIEQVAHRSRGHDHDSFVVHIG